MRKVSPQHKKDVGVSSFALLFFFNRVNLVETLKKNLKWVNLVKNFEKCALYLVKYIYPNSITIRRKHHVLRWNLIFFYKIIFRSFLIELISLYLQVCFTNAEKTVKKYQFSKSMCDIPSIAKCKQRYMAYCIRGTLRGKVELDHIKFIIMFMSEHRKKDLSVVMPENAQVT